MKKVLYLIVIVFILFVCWENQKEEMVIASSNESVIPEEAIRLRIIANSDLPEDQWVKREVRDAVVKEIDKWIGDIDNISDARTTIDEYLPALNKIIKDTVETNGFSYSDDISVELGIFGFPTKMYGQTVYPAGDYEALKIVLGEGSGQNWWCVLFPPLCFVDMDESVISDDTEVDESKVLEEDNEKEIGDETEDQIDEEVEVKFFLVELFEKIMASIRAI